jgi:hypothetical protein
MHTNSLCILYYITLALHVSGTSFTHHQEHKLQSTAVGTRHCYGVLELGSPLEQVAAVRIISMKNSNRYSRVEKFNW